MAILHSVSYGTSDNTLVFIGSLGSTTDMWLPQLDALHKDFRVIAVDHRGHGLSELIEGTPTVADLAQDVLDTLDDLGVGSFGVIGLSLGGAVAQYLAATSDRVTKAAFMCTAAKFGEPQGWLDRAAACRENGTGSLSEAVIQRWFSPTWLENNPASREHFEAMVAGTPSEGYALCCEALATWDFTDRLGEITVPVLTIAGADDPSTPPATVQIIVDGVGGESRAEVLSPAAHVPTVERPNEVNELLAQHFA
ncbi:putative hydrolase/acyltransferase [Corynebacterium glutamicum MT]|uniref:3-oxoadipate enol-lactonase n=1 Tax=Corynebacterium glutamicum TaxID=1718 RepID=A0AB36I6S2_CORGT|nr:3-oxoadipate enol-lactonase [Corynebacterium glutamicum]AGN19895.1 3-oxoadipate enol-lactone hydrolase/4-carboxymuconolactone decarboxylase [Corynebacterium glutamicum SCgG1]AGN22920.1 3-oxoadipate enol-lactone hydrolase/4-carboxymuconolactone decarboxylase [Corynebacterium glutamicum SCgG2]EGV40278.1 3-oxoadipate enol-lactone hydrolase/4-carboxymuconolactone decarboxylase [Corynebacterium glutamicum S9114]EOA63407.1 putative hydrolase/acyltransferase [Corynebacterium glutamicum MT]EPP39998